MDDIQLLAHILQGEAAVMGPAGMTAVAAVFIARLLSPAFPSTVPHVAPAFYGRATPGCDALQIATYALHNPTVLLAEHGTYLYCFSAQDRRRLQLRPADRTLRRSRVWQLHLYKEDPIDFHNPLPAAPVSPAVHGTAHAPHQDTRLR